MTDKAPQLFCSFFNRSNSDCKFQSSRGNQCKYWHVHRSQLRRDVGSKWYPYFSTVREPPQTVETPSAALVTSNPTPTNLEYPPKLCPDFPNCSKSTRYCRFVHDYRLDPCLTTLGKKAPPVGYGPSEYGLNNPANYGLNNPANNGIVDNTHPRLSRWNQSATPNSPYAAHNGFTSYQPKTYSVPLFQQLPQYVTYQPQYPVDAVDKPHAPPPPPKYTDAYRTYAPYASAPAPVPAPVPFVKSQYFTPKNYQTVQTVQTVQSGASSWALPESTRAENGENGNGSDNGSGYCSSCVDCMAQVARLEGHEEGHISAGRSTTINSRQPSTTSATVPGMVEVVQALKSSLAQQSAQVLSPSVASVNKEEDTDGEFMLPVSGEALSNVNGFGAYTDGKATGDVKYHAFPSYDSTAVTAVETAAVGPFSPETNRLDDISVALCAAAIKNPSSSANVWAPLLTGPKTPTAPPTTPSTLATDWNGLSLGSMYSTTTVYQHHSRPSILRPLPLTKSPQSSQS